jgi:hypothetical protein
MSENSDITSTTTWQEIIEACLTAFLRMKTRFPDQKQQSHTSQEHLGDPARSTLPFALVHGIPCAVSAHRFVNGRKECLFAQACK